MHDQGLNTTSQEREATAVRSIRRQAKVATLICEGHGGWYGEPITSIKNAAPNLSVLRLAVIDRITHLIHPNVSATSAIDIDVDVQIVLRGLAQRYPPTCEAVGFPMSQCCKAFRLGYECHHHVLSTWPRPKRCTLSHIVHDIGLYVFECEETTSHTWNREDLVDLLPLKAYPKHLLEALPPAFAEKLVVYPFKMLGWKELDFRSSEM